MSKPEFDQYAEQYDEILASSVPEGLNESYFAEYKIALVASHLKSEKVEHILDFGCGAGRSLSYITNYFASAELWGYDLSSKSLEVAAQRTPAAQLSSDWNALPSRYFDLIVAANVFHHIPLKKRVAALEKCYDALNQNGQLFLFEHNPYNPATRWIFEKCPFDVNAEMLSLKETMRLAQQTQFHIVQFGYTLFFPRPLAFLRKLEPLLEWLPLGAQYYVQMAK
jgi:cyclopropane fatty-acyl-phospholipid synthase-like methyltransferase